MSDTDEKDRQGKLVGRAAPPDPRLSFVLRDATPGDAPIIAGLVKALAEYEELAHEANATADDFHAALFGTPPRAYAMLAEIDDKPVGFALWFYNFSTFLGRQGLYVEDVYVDPDHRGLGIGRALFAALAARAVAEQCGRMEWWVLDWNEPARRFYRALGAEPMSEWTVQRLSGASLEALAQRGTAINSTFKHQEHQEDKLSPEELDRLAHIVVDAGLTVHRKLGPGLLESAYEHCLAQELLSRGLSVRRQVAVPIVYQDTRLDTAYRLDMVIEDSIVLEIKAVDALTRLHEAQILTYLKLSHYRLGFLMNFNVTMFKQGIRRLIV
ncbi:MAG: GxxExxY protein [Rhodospirillales bacterium]